MTKPKQPRLTPALFHILLCLAEEEEKHGYGIMLEVRERTAGAVKLGPGSLYWSLDRLEEAGLIEPIPEVASADDAKRRNYYRLTTRGKVTLSEETQKLAIIVELARERAVIE